MGRHIEKDTVEEELDPRTTLEIEAFLAWLDVQRGLSPTTQIAYGTDLRQLALVIILTRAGLSLELGDLKRAFLEIQSPHSAATDFCVSSLRRRISSSVPKSPCSRERRGM